MRHRKPGKLFVCLLAAGVPLTFAAVFASALHARPVAAQETSVPAPEASPTATPDTGTRDTAPAPPTRERWFRPRMPVREVPSPPPVRTVKPVEPARTVAPSQPAKSVKPTEPVRTVKPVAPAEPAKKPEPAEAPKPAEAATAAEATEPAQPTDPGTAPKEGPGLAEATGVALDTVLDAARRDTASWARRTTKLKDDLEAGAAAAWRALREDPIASLDGALAAAGLPDSQTLALPAAGVVVVLIVLFLVVHGRGDLKVSIEYPAELRGTFSVRIHRKKSSRKGPRMASPAAAERAKRKASAASKTERHLVSRETDFASVPTGRWHVTIDGFVQPAEDETVIATYFEEQEVRVRRSHTVRVDFDLRPKQCPVDVKVTWDKRPVNDALVAWRGRPHSVRYVRGGPLRMGVERGEHTLVVGSGDRVAEVPVTVASFQSQTLEVDLTDRDRLLFTGCPPAVEPYLHGDVQAAARALEREGQIEVSHLLMAWVAEERDQILLAAEHYVNAGLPSEAAEIHKQLSKWESAAELYESAGDFEQAAEMYRTAGKLVEAGERFERARQYDTAAECYQSAGHISKWCESLEKLGRPFEAARIAIEHGEQGRAIRSLQLLSPSDEEYVEAGNLLVDVLQREGHLDMALEKVEELVRARGADSVPLETCDRLAKLLEEHQQYDRAIDVLDMIRRRDPTFPEVAARIEELRKQRHRQLTGQDPSHTHIPGAEAFTSAFRYEILEELGRGGMGIVFKARDRRLGRVVALKRLPDNLRNHPKAVELFLREARAAAALNHPNIVTIHDAGREGDTFYITMELLEGHPLHTILKRNEKLSARDVAKLGLQVCAGLQYAHSQRIVHRDIKTGNLFFTTGRVLKIMDFGLAKMVEEVRRASTVIGGTPYYMAPEQSLGGAVDHRADLYALGVTFFELVAGKVPFPDGDVAYHHRHTPPPDLRERVPGTPDALAELVAALMAKEPEQRPAHAGEVRDRLQALLDSLSS